MKQENEFISILGEASWEDSVQQVLEKYNLDKPDENSFLSIIDSDDFYIHMEFNDKCGTPSQKSKKAEGNSYLQVICFDLEEPSEEDIELPFGIHEKQSYEELVKIIGHATYQGESSDDKTWLLKKENGERYQLSCRYWEELTINSELRLDTYDSDILYTLIPNELLKEN